MAFEVDGLMWTAFRNGWFVRDLLLTDLKLSTGLETGAGCTDYGYTWTRLKDPYGISKREWWCVYDLLCTADLSAWKSLPTKVSLIQGVALKQAHKMNRMKVLPVVQCNFSFDLSEISNISYTGVI